MAKSPGRAVLGKAGVQSAGATRAPASALAKNSSEHSILQLQQAAGNRSCAALLGPRRELAQEDRAWLEKAAGPLPEISLHEGGPANAWIDAAGAEAGALGSSVVLPAPGRQASSRRLLLAHEVAHVFQQRAPHLPRGDANTLEHEADRFASSAASGAAFQIQHSAPVGWAFKMKPEASANVGAAATAPAVAPLEEALKNLPKLSPDEALAVLKQFQKVIVGRISAGEGRIRELMALRAESFTNYLIGGTIEAFGWTSLPSDDWQKPWRAVNAAYDTMAKRQIGESLTNLLAAADATSQAWEELNKYLEQTEKGADRSIFALQVLQAAGAVAATALTGGGATAIAVGAGYAATTNLAGQATSVAIGIQDRIDWAGLAFDTVFGALTGALGGRLGNAVLKRLLANKAVASFGRRMLAEVVTDLVSGRLSSILHTVGRSLFDQLRGRESLTMEQFIERLADQLMDPKAMLLDAIMGRASKIAHAKPAKKQDTGAAKTPEAEVVKTPEPEVVKTPEPEVVKAPEPEVVKTPEPEVVKAPEPEKPAEIPSARNLDDAQATLKRVAEDLAVARQLAAEPGAGPEGARLVQEAEAALARARGELGGTVPESPAAPATPARQRIDAARAALTKAEGDLQAAQALAAEPGASAKAGKALVRENQKAVEQAKKHLDGMERMARREEIERKIADLQRDIDDVLSKTNIEPAMASEEGKKLLQLRAQKKAAAGEVEKLQDDWYERLRGSTPQRGAEGGLKRALENMEAVAPELMTGKGPVDVTSPVGAPIEGTISPDHIFPVSKIRKIAGFEELTPAQQLQVLELTENYFVLSRSAQSSKLNRTMAEWFKTPLGSQIPLKLRSALLAAERTAEQAVRARIDELLRTKK